MLVKAHATVSDSHIGVEFQQQFGKGFDLGTAHMPGPVLPAVEVRGVHHVVVHQQQVADAAAGKHQRCIGAKTACAGNADARGVQRLQLGWAEVGGQSPV